MATWTDLNTNNNPATLYVSNDTICGAGNVDFTISGGSLGTLANWELYATSCSGSPIATTASNTFSNIAVSSSDTYFAKANGYCNTTCLNSVDVLLATSSTDPISVTWSSDTLICENNNVILAKQLMEVLLEQVHNGIGMMTSVEVI